MAWAKEIGPDGLPMWRGADGIYNPYFVRGDNVGGYFCVGMATALVFIGLSSGFAPFATLCCVSALATVVFLVARWRPQNGKFAGSKWLFLASNDDFVFKGGSLWTVPLDAVARVETGRTAEYSPSRNYKGLFSVPFGSEAVQAVSVYEWQTFLFLNDGTRRVIYHANAARDDCAALAASIREYVEQARHSAPASPSAPASVGFDV